ncbi:MAG: ABC transporter substrate-binding protein [Thaumarchaeota archaeon]|nr:ABC transporter substrate-binding protein [Nitrososphaerota archaeon]
MVSTKTVGGGSTTTTTKTTTAAGSVGLCNGQTVTIGGLFDLTDGLSAQGISGKNAMNLAVADINDWLTSNGGCDVHFAATVTDDNGDPNKSLQNLQALHAAGVQVAVGPTFSDAVVADLSYANSNHMVLISPSSTAASLSLPDDYLFRLVPADTYQAQADVAMMLNYSVQAVIVLYHLGTYASGLANATAFDFEAAGGHVVDKITYPKDTVDFTPTLSTMLDDWNTAVATYGADHVAIYTVSFEELGHILAQANDSASYSALLNTPLPWFGDDGQAQDTLLTNSTVGPYMAKIRLPATIAASPGFTGGAQNTKTSDFLTRYQTTYGVPASNVAYTLATYDSTWIAALSTLAANANDGTKIQTLLPGIADNYFGVSGWTILGPSGDLIPLSGYQIWSVIQTNDPPAGAIGTAPYVWVQAGSWNVNTGQVTWISKP